MKPSIETLTEQQMKAVNGGDGILAYDPITGEPFHEETGGYPQQPSDGKGEFKSFPQDDGMTGGAR